MVEIVNDRNGMMTIRVSEALLRLLGRLRWFQSVDGAERLIIGQLIHLRDGTPVSPYVGFYKGDQIPQIGAFSYSSSPLDRLVSVGSYSSISWNVRVMGLSHPLNCFSTTAGLYQAHAMFKTAYEDAGQQIRYQPNPQKSMPVIGNDVWIGQDVLLGRGITIGDGAVIAAGSVVVKDVLPYQIVGGVPAKLLRYRFPKASRTLLQSSSWWEYRLPDLTAGIVDDIPAFVRFLKAGIDNGTIVKIAKFPESFTDIIRSGQIETFLNDDGRSVDADRTS